MLDFDPLEEGGMGGHVLIKNVNFVCSCQSQVV